jgi:hypothetical protein
VRQMILLLLEILQEILPKTVSELT